MSTRRTPQRDDVPPSRLANPVEQAGTEQTRRRAGGKRRPKTIKTRADHQRQKVALAAAGVVLGIVGAWLVLRSQTGTIAGSGGLPGPIGGPGIAQDINTLIGRPAPGFTLADSEGTRYTVTPGQGRPIVLVFHMGIT